METPLNLKEFCKPFLTKNYGLTLLDYIRKKSINECNIFSSKSSKDTRDTFFTDALNKYDEKFRPTRHSSLNTGKKNDKYTSTNFFLKKISRPARMDTTEQAPFIHRTALETKNKDEFKLTLIERAKLISPGGSPHASPECDLDDIRIEHFTRIASCESSSTKKELKIQKYSSNSPLESFNEAHSREDLSNETSTYLKFESIKENPMFISEKERSINKYLDDKQIFITQPNKREMYNDLQINKRKELVRAYGSKNKTIQPNRKNKKLLRLGSSSSCDDIKDIVNL